MRSFFARYRLFWITFLIIASIIMVLFYRALQPRKVLPVYQPADFNPELVDPGMSHIKKYQF